MTSGYLSPSYAESFKEFGEILSLPSSGISFIKRPIVEGLFDLIGLYPYVMSRNWTAISSDWQFIEQSGAVSLVLVTDPFEQHDWQKLLQWDICRPFKTHHIVDLSSNWRGHRSKEVRRLTNRAIESHSISIVSADHSWAERLWPLYLEILDRHQVTGLSRLSQDILAEQLDVEGALLIVAKDSEGIAGAILSYVHGQTANAHLLFLASRARKAKTSFALYYSTLEALQDAGCTKCNLGGGAGAIDSREDGLFQFKQRWATDEASTYLCGIICDHDHYNHLSRRVVNPSSGHFPLYRAPAS